MKTRCEHTWTPLFQSPTEANTQTLRIDSLFYLRYAQAEARICTQCGAHGWQSRGYSRGGVQKIHPCRELYSAEFVAEADAWNLRVQTELTAEQAAA